LLQGRNLGARGAAIARLRTEVARLPGVAAALGSTALKHGVFVTRDGSAARFVVVLRPEALDARAIDVLRRVREQMPVLKRRAGLADARISYAGDTAIADEAVRSVRGDALRVGLVV